MNFLDTGKKIEQYVLNISNEIQYTQRNYAAFLSDGHQVDRMDMRFAGDQFCGAVQQRGFPSLPFTRMETLRERRRKKMMKKKKRKQEEKEREEE